MKKKYLVGVLNSSKSMADFIKYKPLLFRKKIINFFKTVDRWHKNHRNANIPFLPVV